MPITRVVNDKRAREKPCLRCGSTLRDVVERHCPKCGLSLWVSLGQNDSLDASHPGWQGRAALGAIVLAMAAPLGVAGFGLRAFSWFGGHQLLGAWLCAGYFVIQSVGLYVFCGSEGRHPERVRGVRFAAWACAIVGVLAGVAMVLEAHLGKVMVEQAASDEAGDGLSLLAADLTGQASVLFAKAVLVASVAIMGKWTNVLARRGHWHRLAALARWASLGPLIGLALTVPVAFFCLLHLLSAALEVIVFAALLTIPAMMVPVAIMLHRTASEATSMWAAETKAAAAAQPAVAPVA